ncbi:antitoxin VbhA family protein [Granulicella tundricola]|uniref:Antitoxin VbhA domain-containing protein n=1 Tax=Granulicella tundricola (strain ATCC BAA-1859 / DSM 23138 / MP5ACTX9) TaxID=1198114 RepID=E8WZS5_GRATM|nr:antitoxin VbhA family protein [Granulicella tundricola]ADW67736.1 hypothetical protein AciX9_0666 [Granulicella tundricola MP5ACTX9]
MQPISDEEKSRRRRINQSVIGTNAMEGLSLDEETLSLMRRYEEGEIDREELSSAIDLHVARLLRERSALAGAA